MDITYIILSILWFIVGVLFMYSTKKIGDKPTRKYVFIEYLLTWAVLMTNLIFNIFR